MFKKISIVTIAILVTLTFIIGVFLFVTSGGTKSSDKIFSPDGEYSAQIVEIDGGATTGHTTVVSIVNEKSFFKNFDFFNVWIGDKFGVLALNGVKSSVKILWINNRNLKITYIGCKNIYSQDKSWRDIEIVYEGSCSDK